MAVPNSHKVIDTAAGRDSWLSCGHNKIAKKTGGYLALVHPRECRVRRTVLLWPLLHGESSQIFASMNAADLRAYRRSISDKTRVSVALLPDLASKEAISWSIGRFVSLKLLVIRVKRRTRVPVLRLGIECITRS